jgi:hypothetical protein
MVQVWKLRLFHNEVRYRIYVFLEPKYQNAIEVCAGMEKGRRKNMKYLASSKIVVT